jgi:hypothetical protein
MLSSRRSSLAAALLGVFAMPLACGGSDGAGSTPSGVDSGANEDASAAVDTGADDAANTEDTASVDSGATDDATDDAASADSGAPDTAVLCDDAGACPGDRTCCGGTCVDTKTSTTNCGACGTFCSATGEACVDGACRCPGAFADVCGGACTDLTKSPNCGKCDVTCAADTACAAPKAPAAPGCAPTCFAAPTTIDVPSTGVQVAYESTWGAPRTFAPATADRGAVLFDDATGKLASALMNVPAVGATLALEATRVQAAVKTALGTGTTDGAIGLSTKSHEGNAGSRSTYFVARATNASDLRDAVAGALLGGAPPAPATKVGAASSFLVTVTTVLRAADGRTDVFLAIAPRTDAELRTGATILRIGDLTNTTALAAKPKTGGFACQLLAGANPPKADILWTVDTSGSMSDDQDRIGRAGKGIFDRLLLAGVDFRMGVMTAGSVAPNLDAPGFTWISGTDPDGPNELCRRVTYAQCSITAAETKVPYAMGGGLEEPTAAAVLTHYALYDRAAKGETDPNKKLRDGARFVAFLVTDEPGSNDFNRYFATKTDPQTAVAWGTTYTTTTLSRIVDYFVRNQIITFGLLPPSSGATACTTPNVFDLPRCVVEGNGGSAINITTATEAQIEAAFTTIADLVGATVSPYKLAQWPISSTLRVKVNGKVAPRSRNDGWDFDPQTRTLAFYGITFRPKKGDEIIVEGRTWE